MKLPAWIEFPSKVRFTAHLPAGMSPEILIGESLKGKDGSVIGKIVAVEGDDQVVARVLKQHAAKIKGSTLSFMAKKKS